MRTTICWAIFLSLSLTSSAGIEVMGAGDNSFLLQSDVLFRLNEPFDEGVFVFSNDDDELLMLLLEKQYTKAEAKRAVRNFQPSSYVVELDLTFVRTLKGPSGCKVYEYKLNGNTPAFVAYCYYKEYVLFALGMDLDDIEFVFNRFRNGDKQMVPSDYEEVD